LIFFHNHFFERAGCGIKQNDFLVVMVTKAKKIAAKAPAETAKAPAAAPGAATKPAADEENKASKSATSSSPTDAAASAPTESTNSDADANANANEGPALPEEVVNSLTSMGFPEAEVRHCLRAANGNPDIAVEFLTNGIPPGMQPGEQEAMSNSAGSGGTLAGLRNHPQFNDLRRLVQSNPAMLQRVLTQIGQQQPELLTEINANQELFLQMMNEPITETSARSSGSSSNTGSASQSSASSGTDTEMQGISQGMMEGMANPAQMAQLIQNMSPGELDQMATMMGLSSEQLRSTAQMLGQIPPEQLQQYMMQAMQGGGGGSPGGMMGGGGGGGPQVLRLTEEEMAAVNRLADMGFDRTEAAQAYLACDKNEALAANLLMDSMDGGGFGGGGSGDGANNNGNDGDDMYD
jgi:UV excision repair protein RAD23